MEEEEFIDLIDALSTQEEKSRLITQFSEFNEMLLEPHCLTLPFMFFNLDEENRTTIQKAYPTQWFTQLHSDECRDKWESMRPFLFS